MSRSSIRAAVLATAFLASACAKTTPAPIEMKGQNNYSRYGAPTQQNYAAKSPSPKSSYSASSSYKPYEPAPVYTNTQKPIVSQETTQTAAVQSIGVSDLPPPTKTAKAEAKPEPQQIAKAEPKTQTAGVNKWTGKPREESKEKVLAKVESHKPVKLLDAKEEHVGFMWPVSGKKVVSGFGPKGKGKANDGINIASSSGEPVWASSDGEIVYVGNELSGYGNMVIIKHGNNKSTTYAHLSSSAVDKYDRVKQGDIIGYVGKTGNVKSPQLHFAIRDGKTPVDPRKYVSTSVAGL